MSDTPSVNKPIAPPPGFSPTDLPPEDTAKWPKVIGVISLIYALGGLLCGVSWAVMTMFLSTFMAKVADADVDLPTSVRIATLVVIFANLILGVMMIVGAVALLRRKRSGVKLLQRWAILRMVVLLIGTIVTTATASSQIAFQRGMAEAGNRRLEENNMATKPIPSDEEIYRKVIINTAVMSGIIAIYPMFIGFYLSRRSMKQQIGHWPSN